MFRRLLLISLLSASTWLMAQSSAPPDTPAPQPDAGQQKPQPAAQPAPAKPTAEPDPSDPASRPDWKPGDTDQGYEKKTMGQRMKDQVNSPVCVNGHCFGGKKPGDSDKDQAQGPGPSQKPPRSDDQTRSLNEDGESSSRSTIGDISPPKDDVRNHPESSTGNEEPSADVSEMKKWDPHRAAKNVEVGDFYFGKQNYVAAKSRYEEALEYKDNYAEAMYKLAVADEKLEHPDEARKYYQLYLKTLPQGDYAQASRDALTRLGDKAAKKTQ